METSRARARISPVRPRQRRTRRPPWLPFRNRGAARAEDDRLAGDYLMWGGGEGRSPGVQTVASLGLRLSQNPLRFRPLLG